MESKDREYFERILHDQSYVPGQVAMQISQIGLGRFQGWHRMGMLTYTLRQAQQALEADAPQEKLDELVKGFLSWAMALAWMLERALAHHELKLEEEQ